METSRRGIASYLVVGSIAMGLGVAATWLATRPRLDAVTTHGEWVHIKKPTGDSVRAYVAYPERSDKAPAMIVIHEIFGLTDWEPTVGDRLASKGFIAIVPDMLSSRWGQTPADTGRALMAQLTPDGITADLDAAYNYANSLPSVRTGQIGVMGFCWGGGQTFRYATNNPNLKAAVVCYGPNPDTTTLARIRTPILGVYGENDNRINSMLPAVGRIMAQLGKPFEADSYPGTGHGFLKPGRRGSDGDQVEKAWAKIEAFLKRELDR